MLSSKSRVLRLTGPRRLALETQELGRIQQDGLLAEVLYCAICGTDLKIFRGEKKVSTPVLGHEFCAKIIDVGENIRSFEVGERITVATTLSCGHCLYCCDGLGNLCENPTRIGIDLPGAFADHIQIPELALQRGNVLRVPESLSSELVVLAEPLSCVLNGQQLAGLRPGMDILVAGAGPIGLLHVQTARLCGARRIILSETNPNRIQLARAFEADVLVDPTTDDLAGCVNAQTGGFGVDLAIVCSSSPAAVRGLTEMLRKRGTLSLFAGLGAEDREILLDGRAIHYRELTITGASDSRPEHFALALRLLDAFPETFRPLITHTYPLEKGAEAFEILEEGKGLKVILKPGGAA